MFKIQRKFVESCLLILQLLTLFLLASLSATAQEMTNSQAVQGKVTRKANELISNSQTNFQPLHADIA